MTYKHCYTVSLVCHIAAFFLNANARAQGANAKSVFETRKTDMEHTLGGALSQQRGSRAVVAGNSILLRAEGEAFNAPVVTISAFQTQQEAKHEYEAQSVRPVEPVPFDSKMGQEFRVWHRPLLPDADKGMDTGDILFRRDNLVVNVSGHWPLVWSVAQGLDRLLTSVTVQQSCLELLALKKGEENEAKSRREAAAAAEIIPNAQVQTWMYQLITAKNDHERQRLLLNLWQAKDPAAVPVLLQHLDTSKYSPVVVYNAMLALSAIRDKRAIAPLTALALRPVQPVEGRTPDENLRLEAANERDYTDDEKMLRQSAVTALGEFDDDASVAAAMRQIAANPHEYRSVKKTAAGLVDRIETRTRERREEAEASRKAAQTQAAEAAQ